MATRPHDELRGAKARSSVLVRGFSALEIAKQSGQLPPHATEPDLFNALKSDVAGPMGPQGPQGLVGPPGPQGIQGLKGDTGAQGPQGLQGPQGPQGLKGDKGDQGIQGIQGLKGDKGDRGDIGPMGPQGPQGIQGPIGPTGATGASFDPDFVVPDLAGRATHDADPENTSVLVTGEGNLYFRVGAAGGWSAPVPFGKGEQGDPGPQGPQGIQGPVGPAGPEGDSAYAVAVANGFVGTEADWLASLEGPMGPQGPQGIKGDQGDIGPQGPQGLQGPEGPQGIQGPVGPQGDVGPQGPAGADAPQGEVAAITGVAASRALALGDKGAYLRSTAAGAITLTVPTNAAVAFPVKTIIQGVQAGAGVVTIGQSAGVTVNAKGGGKKTNGQFATWTLIKVAADEWDLMGDLTV